MKRDEAVTISRLSKSYGKLKAVDNISLHIPKGQFFAFLGPNGAGKTTVINCITGLSTFRKGTITVSGKDVVQDYKEARQRIGLSPQEFQFDPYFNIKEMLLYQAGYFGIPKKEAERRADRLLKQFDLYKKKDSVWKELSGGMKRRLSIAKAMIHDPDILILDEPTAGLDVELRKELWAYIQKINKQGKTIFLTTHYIEEAQQLASEVCIINKGKIIEQSGTSDLLQRLGVKDVYLHLDRPFSVPDRFRRNVRTTEKGIHIRVIKKNNPVPEVMRLLNEQGIAITDIRTKQESLEEIFLKLTNPKK